MSISSFSLSHTPPHFKGKKPEERVKGYFDSTGLTGAGISSKAVDKDLIVFPTSKTASLLENLSLSGASAGTGTSGSSFGGVSTTAYTNTQQHIPPSDSLQQKRKRAIGKVLGTVSKKAPDTENIFGVIISRIFRDAKLERRIKKVNDKTIEKLQDAPHANEFFSVAFRLPRTGIQQSKMMQVITNDREEAKKLLSVAKGQLMEINDEKAETDSVNSEKSNDSDIYNYLESVTPKKVNLSRQNSDKNLIDLSNMMLTKTIYHKDNPFSDEKIDPFSDDNQV